MDKNARPAQPLFAPSSLSGEPAAPCLGDEDFSADPDFGPGEFVPDDPLVPKAEREQEKADVRDLEGIGLDEFGFSLESENPVDRNPPEAVGKEDRQAVVETRSGVEDDAGKEEKREPRAPGVPRKGDERQRREPLSSAVGRSPEPVKMDFPPFFRETVPPADPDPAPSAGPEGALRVETGVRAIQRKLSSAVSVPAFLLVLCLAAGTALAAWVIFTSTGGGSPSRGVSAAEGLAVIDSATSGDTVLHQSLGPLFVIRGQVKNIGLSPKSHIRVEGRLFNREGFVKTAAAYCGNALSEEELVRSPLSDIEQRLSIRRGSLRSNVNLAPGETIPFMIVITGLPQDLATLDRFSVRIVPEQGAGSDG